MHHLLPRQRIAEAESDELKNLTLFPMRKLTIVLLNRRIWIEKVA